jgi:hypothetical protein
MISIYEKVNLKKEKMKKPFPSPIARKNRTCEENVGVQ